MRRRDQILLALCSVSTISLFQNCSENLGGSDESATIQAAALLSISPSVTSLVSGNKISFSATGGAQPYTFSMLSGNGSVTPQGEYTAPQNTETDTVQVTDANNHTSVSTISVSLQTITLTVSSGATDYNVFEEAGSPTTPVQVNITINAGVTISSTSATVPALESGALPEGSLLSIVNNGNIYGAGGYGGAGGAGTEDGSPGQNGGAAISTSVPITIDNTNGDIFGGGGGGGGSNVVSCYYIYCAGSGGGGGQGSVGGAGGGAWPGGALLGYSTSVAGNAGGAGSVGGAGAGGAQGATYISYYAGAAGAGGSWGQSGSTAATGYGRYGESAAPSGGAGGNAVSLNSNSITWIGGNTATQVRGAVN